MYREDTRGMEFDWAKQETILMEPFEYIHKLSCKHLRMIPSAFDHWLQTPEEKLNIIRDVNDIWCTWNILLDDIIDDSSFRYGVPAAHQVFGVALTINAANKCLMVLLQEKLMELGHPLALKIFLKRLTDSLHGVGIDVYWGQNYIYPTAEAHIEMTRYKSGAHFACPVELMQLCSDNDKDYTALAINIGTYYELLDDYLNLFHQKTMPRLAGIVQENHITCSDITEGKISLSVIHASQFPDVADELADILKKRTSEPTLQNRAISLLKKHGSDEYTKDVMKRLEADIRNEIDQFGGNPILTAFMDDLSFHKQEPEQDLYA